MSTKKTTPKRESMKGQQSLLSFIKVSSAKKDPDVSSEENEKSLDTGDGNSSVPRKRKLSAESSSNVDFPAAKIGKTVSIVSEQEKENIIINTPDKSVGLIQDNKNDVIVLDDDDLAGKKCNYYFELWKI